VGRLKLDELVTATYSIDQAAQALRRSGRRRERARRDRLLEAIGP
jgi:hypothetical protein